MNLIITTFRVGGFLLLVTLALSLFFAVVVLWLRLILKIADAILTAF